MSKIGYLKSVGSNGELHGEIQTLLMQLKIKLVPNRFKNSEMAPDYIICSMTGRGDIEVGGAWKKTKRKIGDIDFEFLSLTIDDMSLPNTLNVAAFKNNEDGWDITWRRRQENKAA